MIEKTCQALLKAEQPMIILPHVSPDGDTIGSSVALYLALKQLKRNAYIVIDDKLPYDFGYIASDIVMTSAQFAELNITYQTAICVDMSDTERLGARKHLIADKFVINIDHHRTNTQFGDVQCIDATAAATGEIIFKMLQTLAVKLTAEMAEALYIAIITDTGNFKYSNTTATTFRIAASLLEVPFDRMRAINNIYHSIPREKVALHASATEQTNFYSNGKIAVCTVSCADLTKHNALEEYTEGLVETIRDIDGVEVVIFIKERPQDGVKVSMRSVSEPDVSKIAFAHDGGGHKNAAGFSLNLNFSEALRYCETTLIPEVMACMAL